MSYILVVDDEDVILKLITFNLEKEGLKVKTARTGQDALSRVKKEKPDVIILDWMMPDTDGLDVCRRLRSESDTIDIPIIMLTARSEEIDKILGLEIGANDYVTKPFSPRELTARVKAQLRTLRKNLHKNAAEDKVINYSNLILDAEKYQVKKGGVKIELTPKEFELLFLLISNTGKVYRRDEILQRVWGYDYPADTRTVDVHIRYLRQKIENEPDKPKLLLTVRGVGYKFQER